MLAMTLGAQAPDAQARTKWVNGCVLTAKAACSGFNLSGADLSSRSMPGSDLSEANLSGADLSLGNFDASDMSGSNLSGAALGAAKLRRVSFAGADLSAATVGSANYTEAVLTGAKLKSVDLRFSILTRVQSGSITGTPKGLPADWKLARGYLIEPSANLRGADLRSVDFGTTNLTGANLAGAKVSGAKLSKAQLTGAALTGLVGRPASIPSGWAISSAGTLAKR